MTDLAGATLFAAVAWLAAGPVVAEPAGEEGRPVRFGFIESPGPAGDRLFRGARAAVEEINAGGGIDGRPLQLVRSSAPEPWRDGAMRTARLVFETDVVALVGPSDAEAAHAAAQIATKKRIPVVTFASEETLTRVKDPWVFSAVPGDGEQARALLRRAFEEPRGKTAVIVTPAGRLGRRHAEGVEQACRELGIRVLATFEDGRWPGDDATRLAAEADALLLWSEPGPAVAVLHRLAAVARGTPRILGSARLSDPAFAEAVPPALSWVAVAAPGLGEALGHDTVWALAASARANGAQPAAIRDGLLEGKAGGGEGRFGFDGSGRRTGSISVSLVRGSASRQEGRGRSDMRGEP